MTPLKIVHSRHHGDLVNPRTSKKAQWSRSVVKTVPRRAIPLVRRLFEEMLRQRATYKMVAERAGVSVYKLHNWRRGRFVNVPDLIACLNVMGMDLIAVHVARD